MFEKAAVERHTRSAGVNNYGVGHDYSFEVDDREHKISSRDFRMRRVLQKYFSKIVAQEPDLPLKSNLLEGNEFIGMILIQFLFIFLLLLKEKFIIPKT